MPAVSNTSPISNLALIGRLDLLLDQFHEVWIPNAVEAELQNVPEAASRNAIAEAMAQWMAEIARGVGSEPGQIFHLSHPADLHPRERWRIETRVGSFKRRVLYGDASGFLPTHLQ